MNQLATNQTHNCLECGGETTLYQFPDRYAGIYECQNSDCGSSFNCEHPATHNEDIEVPTMRNGEYDTYESSITVCDVCGVTLKDEF